MKCPNCSNTKYELDYGIAKCVMCNSVMENKEETK